MNLAIIDTLGLTYNGSTLNDRGLGGSESAVILMSKELTKLGFAVTVFCHCDKPGLDEDGVYYRNLEEINDQQYAFDIVISSRSVKPFAPSHIPVQGLELNYGNVLVTNPYKVLWMHDTFCTGEDKLEHLMLDGYIHKIFTLSDFHTNYVANCDHGHKRHYETMKRFIFQTRNGIGNMNVPEIDISAKDPDLFVYNASVSKGLEPLLTSIWPWFHSRCPNVKLKVIGGYYQMKIVDEQQQRWQHLKDQYDGKYGIEFTGIIKQQEISDILAKASFMVYPTEFPETFGISTLEALAHNVAIITTNFGALETTAIDAASYKMPYSVIKNGLYPLDQAAQIERFKELLHRAYTNKRLHQQKMQAASVVREVMGWDTVAIQWKQFFFKEFGKFMPLDEANKADIINWKVKKIFNTKNLEAPSLPIREHRKFVIISPAYNCANFIGNCIESVANQSYENYEMVIIDDASTDNTYQVAQDTINRVIEQGAKGNFTLVQNTVNKGAVYNHVEAISRYVDISSNDIIVLLDGDDWLANDSDILSYYAFLYTTEHVDFTYGSSWSIADRIPLIAQEYPSKVIAEKSYRSHRFEWGMPYTHLRTFSSSLITEDWWDSPEFFDENGNWVKAGGDNAIFYTILEAANNPKAVKFITYYYNDAHALNDMRANPEEQNKTAERIRSMKEAPIIENEKNIRVLAAIPCKNDIHSETFKSIYDLLIPAGVEVDFQYFWGYRVDQIRNLIADYTVRNGYDYLLAVDHDMILPNDTLIKLLDADADIATGVYIQRLDPPALELYAINGSRLTSIPDKGVIHVGGCGFGGTLVKADVFTKVGYPQFEYHVALDHKDTVSEDTDFCTKARKVGATIKCDTSLRFGHIGERIFEVTDSLIHQHNIYPINTRLLELYNQDLLPAPYKEYMHRMSYLINPKVIYDLGSCVLHWTRHAKESWPSAKFYCVDAMDEVAFLYQGKAEFYPALLGPTEGQPVEFYQNLEHPGGNSVFRENPELSPRATELFPEESKVLKIARTLDGIMEENQWPLPDLIKLDIQGAELATLGGADKCLKHAQDVFIEMQHMDYNMGAPKAEEVEAYLNMYGFRKIAKIEGSALGVDADYHFSKNPNLF